MIYMFISGIERWPGRQLHSHNYRIPDPFQGQVLIHIKSFLFRRLYWDTVFHPYQMCNFIPEMLTKIVVVIGSGPSASDISRDVATVAKEVHLASRSPNIRLGKLPSHQNMWQNSMVNIYHSHHIPWFNHTSLINFCSRQTFLIKTETFYVKEENEILSTSFKVWLVERLIQVVHAKEDGSLVFQDGSSLVADTILYCTG